MTAMFWATLAGPLVALIVGITQCALIWYGIQAMKNSNENRQVTLEALADIGQGIREQNENRQATLEALADIGQGIREQSAGIRALLERS